MSRPKGGLGRGLSALIPQGAPPGEEAQEPVASHAQAPIEARAQPNAGGLLQIPVTNIEPNPRQPRQSFPIEKLQELAESIRVHGIIQPLVVAGSGEPGKYHLVAGERRWRAALLAGLPSVPAVLKEASSRELLELALVENVQRADLNPLEEAAAYRSLVDEFGLKQDEVAQRVGKSRVAVNNVIRLLQLPKLAQDALAGGLITEGHARALLQVSNKSQQEKLLDQIIALELNVRQTEALARRLADNPPPVEEAKDRQAPLYNELTDLEDRFRDALGTKVALSRSRRGGKLVIYFYSDEDLDRIYGSIVGED